MLAPQTPIFTHQPRCYLCWSEDFLAVLIKAPCSCLKPSGHAHSKLSTEALALTHANRSSKHSGHPGPPVAEVDAVAVVALVERVWRVVWWRRGASRGSGPHVPPVAAEAGDVVPVARVPSLWREGRVVATTPTSTTHPSRAHDAHYRCESVSL